MNSNEHANRAPRRRRARVIVPALLASLAAVASAAAQNAAPAALSLSDAARLAAKQSGAVIAARYRADQADARVTQRRADLLPNLSASALENGRTLNTATFGIDFPAPAGQPPIFDPGGQLEGPVNTLDTRAHFAQSIFDAGALGRVRSARAAASASDFDADAIADQAAATAAAAYVRAARADAQLNARVADSSLAEDLLRVARQQLTAGVGVGLDVTRAQSQLAAIRAQIIAVRNDRGRARLELLRTLGLPLDTQISLTDSLGALRLDEALPSETDAIAQALRGRADLRSVDAQLAAVDRQTSAVRAERLPTVAAFGDYGAIGKNGGNMLGTYNWGVQLSVPLFDGFRREGRVEEQTALHREIDVRRRDLREQASVEVRTALLDLASAREAVSAAQERVGLAEQEVAQASERFRAGVAGNADVFTASISLNGARTQVVDALASFQTARIALARAEGGARDLR
ncbi:MAG TPA: TolC family protein [Gemmatimonadaceae bacterium]|nr:TolC family protein [Gemmatimonadaceae bacterium]